MGAHRIPAKGMRMKLGYEAAPGIREQTAEMTFEQEWCDKTVPQLHTHR